MVSEESFKILTVLILIYETSSLLLYRKTRSEEDKLTQSSWYEIQFSSK